MAGSSKGGADVKLVLFILAFYAAVGFGFLYGLVRFVKWAWSN